jgi:hypothetical protein
MDPRPQFKRLLCFNCGTSIDHHAILLRHDLEAELIDQRAMV